MLVVPDYWERVYVRDLGDLLLVQMGFRRLCVQQVKHNSPFQEFRYSFTDRVFIRNQFAPLLVLV